MEAALCQPAEACATIPEPQATVDRWLRRRHAGARDSTAPAPPTSSPPRWSAGIRKDSSDLLRRPVGRDLQFIRINGTVVGGLAGLLIYLVGQLL